MKIHPASILLALSLFAGPTARAADQSYRLARTISAGGEGGWDYVVVDAAARRLYVTRGTRVAVLNADSGAAEGEIPNTDGVHGVALAPDLGRGFTSNGRANTITIFDPKTLATLGTVKATGENPDAILYDPLSHRVFTFNGRSANVTAFEGATGASCSRMFFLQTGPQTARTSPWSIASATGTASNSRSERRSTISKWSYSTIRGSRLGKPASLSRTGMTCW